MAEAVIIPEDRSPSYLNRHALTGAKIGAIAGLGALAVLNPFAAVSTPYIIGSGLTAGAAFMAGTSLGAISGKEMVARNQQSGRKVRAPSLINEGAAQGTLNGTLISLAAITSAIALSAPATIIGIIGALGVAATGLIGYTQCKEHLGRMAVEYEHAKTKAAEMQQGMFDKLLSQFKGTDDQNKAFDTTLDIEQPQKVTKADMEKIEQRSRKYSQQNTRNWAESVQEYNEDKSLEAVR